MKKLSFTESEKNFICNLIVPHIRSIERQLTLSKTSIKDIENYMGMDIKKMRSFSKKLRNYIKK